MAEQAKKAISQLQMNLASDTAEEKQPYVLDATYIKGQDPQTFIEGIAPTKTGGGASGTWGISITGKAGSVDWANTGHPATFPPESHSHPYLPLSGGTLTGNLTGQYLTGTWLRTTKTYDLGSSPTAIAVLSNGYIYTRTPGEIRNDISAEPKGYHFAVGPSTSGMINSYGHVWSSYGNLAGSGGHSDAYYLAVDSGNGLWTGTQLNGTANITWKQVPSSGGSGGSGMGREFSQSLTGNTTSWTHNGNAAKIYYIRYDVDSSTTNCTVMIEYSDKGNWISGLGGCQVKISVSGRNVTFTLSGAAQGGGFRKIVGFV